jgi:hypothetical protein
MKKEISILMVLQWACIGSIIFGILLAFITFTNYGGLFGAFLAVGTLYPFLILQSAYVVWYRGRERKNIWNVVAAITCAAVLFLIIDIAENILSAMNYRSDWSGSTQLYAGQIIFAVLFLIIMIFAIFQNRKEGTSAKKQ